ncbi:polycystin family receptor for egg jelly-like [Rhinoraja longicauda]
MLPLGLLLWAAAAQAVAAQVAPLLNPPIVMRCPYGVSHKLDSEVRYTCLWQFSVILYFEPSPGTDDSGPAPTVGWYIDDQLVAMSAQWWGRQLMTRVPLDTGIRVTYESASCPDCSYRDVRIYAALLNVQFFRLPPASSRLVPLIWCANLRGSAWRYHLNCDEAMPSSFNLSGDIPGRTPIDNLPADKQAECSLRYLFEAEVRYPKPGHYSCSLDVFGAPFTTLQLSVEVGSAITLLLSARTTALPREGMLTVSWQISATAGNFSYQLAARPLAPTSWTLTYHPNAVAAQLCPCTWPHSGQCVAQLHSLLDRSVDLRPSTTTIVFQGGSVQFVHSGKLIRLTPDPNTPGTVFYYISSSNQLYYSRIDSPPGSHKHFLFIRAEEFNHLFQIDYSSPQQYTLTVQLYLSLEGNIYNSLKGLNVSLLLFNNGPIKMGNQANVVWFIPRQHPALLCAWNFRLTIDNKVSSHGYKQIVKDAQRYIPDIQLPIDPKQYWGYLSKVNCLASGDQLIQINASIGSYSPAPVDTILFCLLTGCQVPSPTIEIPPPPYTRIQTAKGTALDIYGNAGLHCNKIQSATISWKVYSMADRDSEPDWAHSVPLPPSVRTTTATLHLPRFSLDYGFYRLILNVSISTTDPNLPFLNNSTQVSVEVTKSALVAMIAGGSFRTVGLEDTVTLDAALSADPDSPHPQVGLNFSWYCTMKLSDYSTVTLSANGYCHRSNLALKWNSSTPQTLDFLPHTLALNKSFHFRVVVQKDTRTSYFDQTILVLPSFVPKMLITCIENCQKSLSPTDRFILAGVCSNCPDSSLMTYQWKLLSRDSGSEVKFDWASKSLTGNSMYYVSLNPVSFIHLVGEWYTFELKATTSNGSQSFNRYNFYVNSPPMDGRCGITPNYGWALHTKFTLTCLKFQDKDQPLLYKVIAKTYYSTGNIDSLKNNLLGVIVYFGFRPEFTTFLLPVGSIFGNNVLIIAVQIFDKKNVYTIFNLKVRVYDVPFDPIKRSLVDHLSSFVEGKIAFLTILLHETDYLRANRLLYIIASTLNSNNFKDKDTAKVIKLRETLVNVSASIPVTSPNLIYQISASIFAAAQKEDELNQNAQRLASTKLLELSLVLLNYTGEAVILSNSVEQLACSILTAASNVMAAFISQFLAQGSEMVIPLTKHQQRVVADIFPTLRTLAEVVSRSKVLGQKDTIMTTSQWEITLRKVEKRDLEDSFLFDQDCANCIYPVTEESDMGATQLVTSVIYKFENNPLPWLGNAEHIATDVNAFHTTTLASNGSVYDLVTKQTEALMVRRDVMFVQRIKLIKDPTSFSMIRAAFRIVVNSTSAPEVFLQLTMDLNPVWTVSIYSGKAFADQVPAQKHIIPQCETGSTPLRGVHIPDPYVIMIPISLFQINVTDPKHSRYVSVIVETKYKKPRAVIKEGLVISIFTVSCLSFQGNADNWDSTSCTAGPLTNSEKVHCICRSVYSNKTKRSLSVKFPWFLTASILVMPNVIDLYEIGELIVTLPKNIVALITVLIIFLIYFILFWWAWRKRESDKKKIIIHPDNDPCDAACYLVTLYSGGRPGAGTTADVFLILVGMSTESNAYLLRHPEHQTFQRSSVDTFLLTAKVDLGELTFIRVWHNNVGHSPSWYLSRVKVQNVLTRQQWHFFCRKWLAVLKGEGLLLGTFPVSSASNLLRRQDVFLIEVSSRIEKEHLWFSIFALHADESFTRIQRLSCCLAMLLSSLLTGIMLFQVEKPEEFWYNVRISFVIAVESALVMIPVELLISGLFVYAQRKGESLLVEEDQEVAGISNGNVNVKSNWRERLNYWYLMDKPASEAEEIPGNVVDMPMDDHYNYLSFIAGKDNIRDPSAKENKNCVIPQSVADQISEEDVGGKKVTMKAKPLAKPHQVRSASQNRVKGRFHLFSKGIGPRNHSILFSQCLMYLAWCTVWLVSIVSAVFIVFYGLSYGIQTSWLWLIAATVSFFQSIFFLQPLKIVAFAALFALSRRQSREMDWSIGIQVLKISADNLPRNDSDCLYLEPRVRKQYRPLEGDELILVKKKAIIKHRAFVLCRRMLLHLIFLGLLLYSVCFADYNNAYYYNHIIQHKFSEDLENVNTVQEFYTWMKVIFLPLIHIDSNLYFFNDTNSVIIGLLRMRQIRSKQRSADCFIKANEVSIILGKFHCRPLFNIRQEDTKNYNGSWELLIESISMKDAFEYTGWLYEGKDSPWFYNTQGEYHQYSLGGYSIYFSPSSLHTSLERLMILQKSSWIDRSTWVVIIEITVYNANVDLLCSISLILETVPLGVISKKLSMKCFSLRLFRRRETNWIFISILFIFFLVIFVTQELRTMRQKGYMYFLKLESIANLIITLLLLIAIVLHVAKLLLSQSMLKFYEKNPTSFIAFHVISALDQLLRMNITFLLFVTIVKLLRFARFLYHVRLVQKAISVYLPTLCSMALLTIVCSLIFMHLGYLLFGQFEKNFNTLTHAAQTIVSYYTGQFNNIDFPSSRILGGIYLVTFLFVINSILINLFESVVILSYADMRQVVYEKPAEEAEMAVFIVQECQRVWYALWRKTPPEGDNEFLSSLLYGQGTKRTYGLKWTKREGKKENYLFI